MVAILCTGPKKLAGQTVTIYVIGDYKRYDKLMKKDSEEIEWICGR